MSKTKAQNILDYMRKAGLDYVVLHFGGVVTDEECLEVLAA